MDKHLLEFREPRSVDELRKLLELRYRVYRESRLANLAHENTLRLDLDSYDVNAMHFGLLREGEPVGYMRLVTDSRQRFADDVIAIASADPSALHTVLQKPEVPFPVMTYAPPADRVKKLHAGLKQKDEYLVEPGRFSLDASVRGRHIATFMVASTFAVTIANRIDNAILCCAVKHTWMYKHFGFSVFPETSGFLFERVGAECSLLLLQGVRAGMAESERERVMEMVAAYKETGSICHNPSQPGVYVRPQEVMSEAA